MPTTADIELRLWGHTWCSVRVEWPENKPRDWYVQRIWWIPDHIRETEMDAKQTPALFEAYEYIICRDHTPEIEQAIASSMMEDA